MPGATRSAGSTSSAPSRCEGTRSGDGRDVRLRRGDLGGYFPGVDTFLGLQVAAQEIADDLARNGFGKRIGPFRSTAQWFKWLAGKQI